MNNNKTFFVLVHHRDDGYDGGVTSTNLFISDDLSTLETKREMINKNRDTGNAKMNKLFEELEEAEKALKARSRGMRSADEMDKIQKLTAELNKDYPFWNLRHGSDNDTLVIEEVPCI